MLFNTRGKLSILHKFGKINRLEKDTLEFINVHINH